MTKRQKPVDVINTHIRIYSVGELKANLNHFQQSDFLMKQHQNKSFFFFYGEEQKDSRVRDFAHSKSKDKPQSKVGGRSNLIPQDKDINHQAKKNNIYKEN